MATAAINGAVPKRGGPRRRLLQQATDLARRFSAAASNCGLYRETSSSAGIPGMTGPTVFHVDLGDRPYLMIRMSPAQLLTDYTEHRDRITEGLAVTRIGITQRAHGVIRIDLDPTDPLVTDVQQATPIDHGAWPVEFGGLETGTTLRESLHDTGHLAAQGQTRSGKTRWSYGLLGQLSGARHIEIAGIDPTGKLLGPWQDHPQGSHALTAESDYDTMEQISRTLVTDMRNRIRAIPRDQDTLPLGKDFPLRLVVLEEWSNVLTLASIAKNKAKGLDTELGRNVQILLAESHKAGYRILTMAQRMDASVVGGFNRDNISHRVSFRTASKDGLKMLHEHIDDDTAETHAVETPGIALVQTPTVPLQRLRAATVPDYSDYLGRIDATRSGAVDTAA